MQYEHVVEALARHLRGHDDWETLCPRDRRTYRQQAEKLLASWDYTQENGVIFYRSLATAEEGVNRKAREVFFDNIIKETLKAQKKHLHKLRMKKHSFDEAVEAVAKYVCEADGGGDWESIKDVAKQALLSRGFHQFDGVLHYADNQCFGHLTGLLQGAFAEQNVRELLRHANETRADKKSDQLVQDDPDPLFEKVIRPADEPVVDIRGTREDAARYVQDDLTPFSTRTEKQRAEAAAASPYPVNEEGAEEYKAVYATVGSVPSAVDVYARELYERHTAGMPMVKPFVELSEELKKTYRAHADGLAYDREKANELYFKQRAADAEGDKLSGDLKDAESKLRRMEAFGRETDAAEHDPAIWDLARREYEKKPYKAVGGIAERDITWDELLHPVKEQLYQKAKKNIGTQPFVQAKDALHDTYVLMAQRLYEEEITKVLWKDAPSSVQSHYIGRAKRSKLDWDEVWAAAGGNKLNEDLKAATTKLKLATEELAGTGPASHADMPSKADPYETLARITCKMLRQAGITVPMGPAIVDVARATWEGRPVTNNLHNNYIAGAVDTFRKIANHNGLTLEQFVSGRIAKDLLNSDDTPTAQVIIVNEEEATAIAWYAYEAQRAPIGVPWSKLDAGLRTNLVDVCSAYFTTRSRIDRTLPTLAVELYSHLDRLMAAEPLALQERVAGLVRTFSLYGDVASRTITLSFLF